MESEAVTAGDSGARHNRGWDLPRDERGRFVSPSPAWPSPARIYVNGNEMVNVKPGFNAYSEFVDIVNDKYVDHPHANDHDTARILNDQYLAATNPHDDDATTDNGPRVIGDRLADAAKRSGASGVRLHPPTGVEQRARGCELGEWGRWALSVQREYVASAWGWAVRFARAVRDG